MLDASVAPTRVVVVLAWLSEAGAKAVATCYFGAEQRGEQGKNKSGNGGEKAKSKDIKMKIFAKQPVC